MKKTNTIDLNRLRKLVFLSTSIDIINSIDPDYLTKETFDDDVPQELIDQWIIYINEKKKLSELLKKYSIESFL